MNNDFFRKLVQDTPARQNDASPTERPKAGPVSALGAKKSSLFGGMTPRPGKAPSSDEFAKQMRERHASLQPTKTKKFRTSAPKGSKIADGYVDRAKARQEAQDEEDDKAERIKALEEQVRLGQLPYETFEALRDKIVGGDVSSTHLVKGLDFKLLERVRRGENVLDTDASKEEAEEEEATVDVDEELEKLQAQKIETAKREKTEKKGIMAPPPVVGVKRSRDEIMAELKAQRKAAAEAKAAAAPTFDDGRWKKIGQPEKPKIELDHKGREVITTVDKDGKVKKKVRKVAVESNAAVQSMGSMPHASKAVLGADFALPQLKPEEPAEDDDEDIFAGAGTEYNPLGDMDDDDGDTKPRNYFGDKPTETDEAKDRFKGIENVLKKASQLGASAAATDEDDDRDESKEEREARLAKRAKMLAQEDRDLEDMDMGFGSSRFEDEQEGGEEKKMRLSEWKGGAAGEEDGWEEDEKGGGKKKRKPKKRKGDVDNAADIFRVIEGRRAAQK
ncbi:uncharacterized protein MYCGRDRAFT_86496 [Zymoseptoria tritici IPO323]|uniref:RED-like N-terminal domain-containing protein n=1 Tax=Zymoseptoria tritici (strain CBS 115943 / IPO323) TaxID=336722 RepID=F9XDA9_ZYMTI|nr:uncharacterized protein MYCGRDRAFT_86496 [Zymoseptoria tritici IPO323]EGP86460.1 hypothetical protein MYCGRDRAFT_86496 [Zymoseptoria tritici IPO323]